MSRITTLALAALATTALTAAARADVIVSYTFPTATAAETGPGYSPTTVAPLVTATAVDDGAVTLEISNPSPTYASQPVLRVLDLSAKASYLAGNDYWFFTVTPDANHTLSLTNMTFNTSRGGTSAPRGYDLQVSTVGTTFTSVTGAVDILTTRATWTAVNVDLSAYQNLAGTVTFRMYGYSPSSSGSIEWDDVILNGTVAPIPEPATASLLALTAVPLLLRRKRH